MGAGLRDEHPGRRDLLQRPKSRRSALLYLLHDRLENWKKRAGYRKLPWARVADAFVKERHAKDIADVDKTSCTNTRHLLARRRRHSACIVDPGALGFGGGLERGILRTLIDLATASAASASFSAFSKSLMTTSVAFMVASSRAMRAAENVTAHIGQAGAIAGHARHPPGVEASPTSDPGIRPYDRDADRGQHPFRGEVDSPSTCPLLTCRSRQKQAGTGRETPPSPRRSLGRTGSRGPPLASGLIVGNSEDLCALTRSGVRTPTADRFRPSVSGLAQPARRPRQTRQEPRILLLDRRERRRSVGDLAGAVVGACSRDPSGRPRRSAFCQRTGQHHGRLA